MYIYPFLSSSNFWFNRAITDMGTRPKLTVTSVVISGRQPIYSVLLLLLVVKGKCDDASEAKKKKIKKQNSRGMHATCRLFNFFLCINKKFGLYIEQ